MTDRFLDESWRTLTCSCADQSEMVSATLIANFYLMQAVKIVHGRHAVAVAPPTKRLRNVTDAESPHCATCVYTERKGVKMPPNCLLVPHRHLAIKASVKGNTPLLLVRACTCKVTLIY